MGELVTLACDLGPCTGFGVHRKPGDSESTALRVCPPLCWGLVSAPEQVLQAPAWGFLSRCVCLLRPKGLETSPRVGPAHTSSRYCSFFNATSRTRRAGLGLAGLPL